MWDKLPQESKSKNYEFRQTTITTAKVSFYDVHADVDVMLYMFSKYEQNRQNKRRQEVWTCHTKESPIYLFVCRSAP